MKVSALGLLSVSLAVLQATSTVALKLDPPSSLIIGQPTTLTWTNEANDRMPWILFLMNASYIWGLYEIIEPIPYEEQKLDWVIPGNLPESDDFVLKAVNASNVDMVWSNSPIFTLSKPSV
ncbi:hypothetical protein D9756_009982 [Leucocoprinus leucothites]|uniref:Uncharacterized protein n=1 Tax=Leucocoprinus leucothites TaxID=201217 RepID=A0A8H5CSY0_9AGAR|nr:hypothetical protein D9756_009982 [Leucoagaricus leucothites]